MTILRVSFAILSLSLLLLGSNAASPAIIAGLSTTGAEYMLNAVLTPLMAEIQDISIPGFSGKQDDFDYSVSDITLNSISYSAVTVTQANNEVTITMSGIAVKMGLHWSYKLSVWPHTPSDHGTADVSFSKSTMTMTGSIVSSNGQPQLTLSNVDCDLNNIDITVHGSIIAWLYNIILDALEGTIGKDTEKAIESEITSLLPPAINKLLGSMTMKYEISSSMYVDYSMTGDAYSTTSFLAVPLLGEFYSTASPQECPLSHVTLTSQTSDLMIEAVMDQFFFNSLFWVMYGQGALVTEITPSMLPASFPLPLNTSTFKTEVPVFYAAYPDKAFALYIYAVDTPTLTLASPTSTFVAYTEVAVLVDANDTQSYTTEAFVLNAVFSADATLYVNATNNHICGSFSDMTVALTLKNSTIGEFQAFALNYLMTTIISDVILPDLNAKFAEGVALPSVSGMSLTNSVITFGTGFAVFDSDFTFTA